VTTKRLLIRKSKNMNRLNLEKFMLERKAPVYVLLLIIILGIFYGWLVAYVIQTHRADTGSIKLGKFGDAVEAVATFPSLVKKSFSEVFVGGPQVISDRFPDLNGLKKAGVVQAGALEDEGYLLVSHYDGNKRGAIVELLRISDQQVLHEWVPDYDAIADTTDYEMIKSSFRMLHPLLLNDGGLVFQSVPSPLFKINPRSTLEWALDGYFHHSQEKDSEENIWVCSRMDTSSYAKYPELEDDAIAKVSPNGELLFKKSVSKILEENGYRNLLAIGFSEDPIHLNDIQPALGDSKYWKKGDLMLSMRNRSTIALYRPTTDKIIWLKTGPWMNQHDVDFVDDHRISVFGNDVFRGKELFDGHNNVYVYDFETDKVSTPYTKSMKLMDVRTPVSGLSEVLSDGDVFVEETEYGRLLLLTPEKAKWEFVSRLDKKHLSLLSWSRYLTEKQVKDILPKLGNSGLSK
jgi:hypothetical protein